MDTIFLNYFSDSTGWFFGLFFFSLTFGTDWQEAQESLSAL